MRYGCDVCQDVCPWNVRIARALPDESPYAPRVALLGMSQAAFSAAFSAAFKGSPMKRATLRGLHRNAAVVVGNVGAAEDAPVLEQALDDPEPLVRERAAWALSQLGYHAPTPPSRSQRTGSALDNWVVARDRATTHRPGVSRAIGNGPSSVNPRPANSPVRRDARLAACHAALRNAPARVGWRNYLRPGSRGRRATFSSRAVRMTHLVAPWRAPALQPPPNRP